MENRIEERRRELGMSQDELAAASMVSRQAISDIETGRHIPRLDTAMMISRALGMSIEELFSMDEM